VNRDAALQRRRLEEQSQSVRLTRERLRQIELEIDDASISLRRARSQLELARDQLMELEERHWALLSLYNADQAEELVDEALEEFQELEPAARMDDFPLNTAKPMNTVETTTVRLDDDVNMRE
jgi:DNA repair exonuclease SbcCD ATPase subunit